MTSFLQLAASLREQMTANLSRSDVLKPLAWLIGLLVTAFAVALWAKASAWVVGAVLVGLALTVLLYMGSYVFCLCVDRDALRSERYSLHKMALEQRLLGDSNAGLFEFSADGVDSSQLAITAPLPGVQKS